MSEIPVIIRPLQNEETEEAAVLIKSLISKLKYYNDIARENEISKYSSLSLCSKLKEDSLSVIGVFYKERMIGFCLSRIDDGLVWLEWFGVREDYRGKGIGLMILEELEETGRKRNCHKIWCDSRTVNKESIALLSKFGFEQITTIENHWYGQDFILWQKLVRNT